MRQFINWHITFELSGAKRRSLFGSGGGPQARNELERFVRLHLESTPKTYFHGNQVDGAKPFHATFKSNNVK